VRARAFNHKRLLMQRDADTGNVKTDCIISAMRIKRAPLHRLKSPLAARFVSARDEIGADGAASHSSFPTFATRDGIQKRREGESYLRRR